MPGEWLRLSVVKVLKEQAHATVTKRLKQKDDVWIYIFRNTGDMTDDYLLKTLLHSSRDNKLFTPPKFVSDTEVKQ